MKKTLSLGMMVCGMLLGALTAAPAGASDDVILANLGIRMMGFDATECESHLVTAGTLNRLFAKNHLPLNITVQCDPRAELAQYRLKLGGELGESRYLREKVNTPYCTLMSRNMQNLNEGFARNAIPLQIDVSRDDCYEGGPLDPQMDTILQAEESTGDGQPTDLRVNLQVGDPAGAYDCISLLPEKDQITCRPDNTEFLEFGKTALCTLKFEYRTKFGVEERWLHARAQMTHFIVGYIDNGATEKAKAALEKQVDDLKRNSQFCK